MKAAALLVLVLLGVARGEIERLYGENGPSEAVLRAAAAKYGRHVAPSLRFSLGGDVVRIPAVARLYFDAAVYEGSSAVVTIVSSRGTDNCTLSVFGEHVRFSIAACAPHVAAAASTFDLDAEIVNGRTGRVETLTTGNASFGVERRAFQFTYRIAIAEVVYVPDAGHPWPLENDNGGWPDNEPNLAANIMENYQSFSGAAAAYWHSVRAPFTYS